MRGEWIKSCGSGESSTYSNWSIHEQNMRIMDDEIPPQIKSCDEL
jgi:hypothetical protein